MWHTGLILVLGCILRYLVHSLLRNFQGVDQGGIFDTFIVGHMRNNISLQEDMFRASHQIQTIGVVQKPLIQFLCKVSAGIETLRSSKLGIDISTSQVHLLMGTIAAAITACFYQKIIWRDFSKFKCRHSDSGRRCDNCSDVNVEVSVSEHTHASDSWLWMIWLNPLLIISSCISPIPSIELLLLLFISISPPAGAFCSFMAFPAFVMLFIVDPTYSVLLPVLWVRSSLTAVNPDASRGSKQQVSASIVTGIATAYLPSPLQLGGLLLSLLATCFYITHGGAYAAYSNPDSAERAVPAFTKTHPDAHFMISNFASCFARLVSTAISRPERSFSHGGVYSPSLGIMWYMDAQVFSEFRTYVSVLIQAQPYLIALPIFRRFGYKQNKECLSILAAVVLLFKPVLCLSDISIAMVMMSTNGKVISTMRRIPFTLLCIVLSACLSLLTVQLWLQQGTGNANFHFFQGLVLWVACAVGIVEFIRAVVVGLKE